MPSRCTSAAQKTFAGTSQAAFEGSPEEVRTLSMCYRKIKNKLRARKKTPRLRMVDCQGSNVERIVDVH